MNAAPSGRIRRSVRFAQLEAQAAAAPKEAPVRRERMTVPRQLEMSSFQNAQNWTDGMGMGPMARFRVPEAQEKPPRPFSREGVRMDWARRLLWVLGAVLCVVLLVEFAAIGAGALRIQKLESRITAAQERNGVLRNELAQASGDISVVTRAVELNLISSGGAATITLTAPTAATLTLVETLDPQQTEEPELRAASGGTE